MDALKDRRVWLGGGAVAALLIIVAAWFLLIHPERSDAANLRDQAAGTRTSNTQLQSKVATLRAKNAKLDQYTASLRKALETLPFDSGLPAFTRQLSAQAGADHVSLVSITVGGISPANSTAAGAGVGASAPVTAPATDAGAPAGTSDPAGAAATIAPTPSTPSSGATVGTVYAVQITVVSDGSLSDQLAFLDAVQYAGPRRALVTGTQFAPGTDATAASVDTSSRMTTQLSVFSAPQSSAQIAQFKKLLAGHPGS